MKPFGGLLTSALVATLSAAALAQAPRAPVRVFESGQNRFAEFEAMLADLARADVVVIGEDHEDRNTHRLELTILEGLASRRDAIALSLEMFDRDVQEPLAHFLMGHMDEAEFVVEARAWPGYETDYKALVDLAIARQFPVVAANVPRPIAADVTRAGLDVLKLKSVAEQTWFARDLQCPTGDRYFKHFVSAMTAARPPSADDPVRQNIEPYYFAQCLKDETMGESIALAYASGAALGKPPVVVHVNGAFHSDFGDGVVARTRRRLPDKRVVVLTILPVAKLDGLAPDAEARSRADYLIFTTRE